MSARYMDIGMEPSATKKRKAHVHINNVYGYWDGAISYQKRKAHVNVNKVSQISFSESMFVLVPCLETC